VFLLSGERREEPWIGDVIGNGRQLPEAVVKRPDRPANSNLTAIFTRLESFELKLFASITSARVSASTKNRGGNQMQNTESTEFPGQSTVEGFWPKGWWSIVDFKIGIVPLPVFIVLLAVIAGFAATGSVPSDILMAIVLLSMGGFTCANWVSASRLSATLARQQFLPRSSHHS
jgi:hypothetical protein